MCLTLRAHLIFWGSAKKKSQCMSVYSSLYLLRTAEGSVPGVLLDSQGDDQAGSALAPVGTKRCFLQEETWGHVAVLSN